MLLDPVQGRGIDQLDVIIEGEDDSCLSSPIADVPGADAEVLLVRDQTNLREELSDLR
jgi:hypothetical protein